MKEYSHVRDDSGFEIFYEAVVDGETYPISVNMTLLENHSKLIYEVSSEKNDKEEIQCLNALSIKNYWQARVMLAFSCDESTKSLKAAFIFKFDDELMIMKTHSVDTGAREWKREISYDGKELLHQAVWYYEPAEKFREFDAEVEEYDEMSSIADLTYDVTLLYGQKVLIHN